MPDFLATLRATVDDDPTFQRADITLVHYVVSTGLRPMIEGSAVRPFIDDVWVAITYGQRSRERPGALGLCPARATDEREVHVGVPFVRGGAHCTGQTARRIGLV